MKPVLAALFLLSLAGCVGAGRQSRADLVGHWRYADSTQSCDYSFKADGSFTGLVRQQAKIVSSFTGRWTVRGDTLLYTYVSDTFGRIPTGATDRDQLLEIRRDSFLIQAANGDKRRYKRIM